MVYYMCEGLIVVLIPRGLLVDERQCCRNALCDTLEYLNMKERFPDMFIPVNGANINMLIILMSITISM